LDEQQHRQANYYWMDAEVGKQHTSYSADDLITLYSIRLTASLLLAHRRFLDKTTELN